MKKFFIALALLISGFTLFAQVELKLELPLLGGETEILTPDGDKPEAYTCCAFLYRENISCEYIFSPVKKLSFYAGGTLGFYREAFMFGAEGGFYYPLFSGKLYSGQLNFESEIDFALSYGPVFCSELNFLLLNQSGKGWFLINGFVFDYNIVGYAYDDINKGTLQYISYMLNFGIGYRF